MYRQQQEDTNKQTKQANKETNKWTRKKGGGGGGGTETKKKKKTEQEECQGTDPWSVSTLRSSGTALVAMRNTAPCCVYIRHHKDVPSRSTFSGVWWVAKGTSWTVRVTSSSCSYSAQPRWVAKETHWVVLHELRHTIASISLNLAWDVMSCYGNALNCHLIASPSSNLELDLTSCYGNTPTLNCAYDVIRLHVSRSSLTRIRWVAMKTRWTRMTSLESTYPDRA